LSALLRRKKVAREPVASLSKRTVVCSMGDNSVISGMQT
jgi:hypothetical protein